MIWVWCFGVLVLGFLGWDTIIFVWESFNISFYSIHVHDLRPQDYEAILEIFLFISEMDFSNLSVA